MLHPSDPGGPIRRYHDGTKHGFHRFARSLGYLDWAMQPAPFRAYHGSAVFELPPAPHVPLDGYVPAPAFYDQLFSLEEPDAAPSAPARRVSRAALGDVLRHALGLTAWKQFRESRWSLRANPSSGNLHPTEAYVVCGPLAGLSSAAGVYHYAPDRHALELRCEFDWRAWESACGSRGDVAVVALTSIHWREAWKYGERAFRYCQHDLGHAIAALTLAGRLAGWQARLGAGWPHAAISTLTGIDRDPDFEDAEREEPACVLVFSPATSDLPLDQVDAALVAAVGGGRWQGRASQLSEDHVQWTFIDEAAQETRAGEPGRAGGQITVGNSELGMRNSSSQSPIPDFRFAKRTLDARRLMIQRRSAVAFDGRSRIDRATFFGMLGRVLPGSSSFWDVMWWRPAIHLALFVHRVDDVAPGLYLLPRSANGLEQLRAAMRREFDWEPAADRVPLVRLAQGDCRRLAARLSCDQDIAADGYFSLGMLADFAGSLAAHGASFYRHLFWESGVIGQVLYLEAEAAGARATGIGCFYDDPVHDVLGIEGHAFQSLYHFTVGAPVEDARLTIEPGYPWETRPAGLPSSKA